MLPTSLFLPLIISANPLYGIKQAVDVIERPITRECTLTKTQLDPHWYAMNTTKAYSLIYYACRSDNCTGTITDVGMTSGSISKFKADLHFQYVGHQNELDEVIIELQDNLVADSQLRLGKTSMSKFYKHVQVKCGQRSTLTAEIKTRRVFVL
jgi:hypothetical protein